MIKAKGEVRAFYSSLGRIRMLGGDRTLDLSNTLHWQNGDAIDFIPDYSSLVKWCVPALLLNEREAKQLLKLAREFPQMADSVHLKWCKLRGVLKPWLCQSAIDSNSAASPQARSNVIEMVSACLGRLKPHDIFAVHSDGLSRKEISLPLLRSAAAIMMFILFPPEDNLRRCEADECGGYFLDKSRAKPRRWCAMDTCGNRAKAARFRLNTKVNSH